MNRAAKTKVALVVLGILVALLYFVPRTRYAVAGVGGWGSGTGAAIRVDTWTGESWVWSQGTSNKWSRIAEPDED